MELRMRAGKNGNIKRKRKFWEYSNWKWKAPVFSILYVFFFFLFLFCSGFIYQNFEGFYILGPDIPPDWLLTLLHHGNTQNPSTCKYRTIHNFWQFENKVRKDQHRRWQKLSSYISLGDKTTQYTHSKLLEDEYPYFRLLPFFSIRFSFSEAPFFHYFDFFILLLFIWEKNNFGVWSVHDLCKSMFDFGMVIEWYT